MDSQINEIKSRLDVVEVIGGYVRLQKAGANWRANCPFHNERTPSFMVSPSRQVWRCFGSCGEGGDMFSFLMKIEGIEFVDALKILAQKAGVVLKREDPKLKSERQKYCDISEKAAGFFEKNLENAAAGKEAKDYLKKRGLKEETIKQFRIGWAGESWDELLNFLIAKGYKAADIEKAGLAVKKQNENRWFDRFRGRIIFPIFDLHGQPIGFGGRIFKGDAEKEAKYLNSPQTFVYDKSKVLYGLNFAKGDIRRLEKCVLVEGYMDLIMAHQDGLKNSVAVSGTALTPFQLSILKRYSDNLVLAFDMDEAGQKAAARGIDLARNLSFNIRVLTLPEGKDPADYALSHPGRLEQEAETAKPIMEYYFEKVFNKFKADSAENKKEIAKILLPQIRQIPNQIEQAHWIAELAGRLGVREEVVIGELKRTRENNDASAETALSAAETGVRQPAERTAGKSPNRPREEVFGDHLVSLLLKYNRHFDVVRDFDFSPLKNFTFALALEYFKKSDGEFNFENIYREMPDHLKNYLNKIELESQNFEIKDPLVEIKSCFTNLQRHLLDNRMEEIKIILGQAEKSKDHEQDAELMARFQQFASERQKLEKN